MKEGVNPELQVNLRSIRLTKEPRTKKFMALFIQSFPFFKRLPKEVIEE